MQLFTNHKKYLITAFILLITFIAASLYANDETVTTFAMPTNQKVVVIDAGHGGWDPGVVTKTGTLEKDINLAVAEQLQILLETGGAYVIMTRADDNALGDSKNQDMNRRRLIAEQAGADIFISIHQNAYASQNIRGAQAFYFGDSDKGKRLAELIQIQFITYLDRDNQRVATANQQYYVLKRTSIPSVLVECGYLTNPNESRLLTTEEYQKKVAWAIYLGIINYFND
jgi:N-acetylmuramoyl-L-alanine amidase